ncbi:MAG: electron transfer flavoprotein subunit beta/FixA family protein [Coriobacteriia bacterium]|nr:electron transfer flavoprotein subunit beta/FixA family protein [Coriobacteriia bacterium]MCL2749640.1 electron transfer flavoprotein subunit beta/FixA family protein [Coriobacteriia bacterium]
MEIIVAMKQVPDLQQVRLKNKEAVLEGVPLTFGDIDKRALEAAVQLRDTHEGTVHLLSIGNEELEDTAKEALAGGADAATLLISDEFADLDSAQVAQYLAAAIKDMDDYDAVLFGEASGDNYSGQVASRVAAILGYPLIGYAQKISYENGSVTVECSYESKVETVVAACPAVISVVSDIAEPRIPAVTAILKAGKKPKEIMDETDVGIDEASAVIETLSALAPDDNRKCEVVDDVGALIGALKAEKIL